MSLILPYYIFFIYFFFLLIIPETKVSLNSLKYLSLFKMLLIFIIFLNMFFIYDKTILFGFESLTIEWFSFFNFFFTISYDSISLFFLLLTFFLLPLCLLFSWNHFIYSFKEFLFLLTFVGYLLFNFFITEDLFFFYICFEGILLPLFIIIGSFGSRQRRIHASFQLFFYTLIGSFFMLFNIIYISIEKGSTDFIILFYSTFGLKIQLILWLFFFFSLSVKIPLFPVHIWLPEAHVEAPTIGSVILAGVLLKMGTYGLIRFLIPILPFANWYFNTLIQVLSFLAIVYISVITLSQIDLKKLIAYSSVAHMGYATIALFVFNNEGLLSSTFLMLNHGIVSSLLFFIIGVLYDRYKTRLLFYFQSLSKYMPLFSLIVFSAMLANIGFPGTSSFIAEFLTMVSFVFFNKLLTFYNGIGLIFSAFYSFWIYNRIFFGVSNNKLMNFSDISSREFFVTFNLVFFVFFFGIFPNIIIKFLVFPLNFLHQLSFINFVI